MYKSLLCGTVTKGLDNIMGAYFTDTGCREVWLGVGGSLGKGAFLGFR